MTNEYEKALEALDVFDAGSYAAVSAPEMMPTQYYRFNREDMRTIRTALKNAERCEGLVKALEKIASVDASDEKVKSMYLMSLPPKHAAVYDMARTAYQALRAFKGE